MGRLKRLPVGPARLAPRVAYLARDAAAEERAREARNAMRWAYGTARWQRLRWSILERDLFTCRMCGRVEGQTSQLVADHIVPHRGDAALFWDAGNLQCLCKACHDGAKQRDEAAAHGGRGG